MIVLVTTGSVVVAVLVAVYVLVVVVLAMTRAPQMTDCGYFLKTPGLPTWGQMAA